MRAYAAAMLGLLGAAGGAAAGELRDDALAAMKKATRFFTAEVACHGGYLWRYSEDMKRREGEGKASPSEVWVQPPGTPAVGLAFVRAFEATGDRQFLDAAVAAAKALVWGQLRSGGWAYHIDFGGGKRRPLDYRRLPPPKSKKVRLYTVLDDNTTQAALRHLMAVDQLVEDKAIHDAALYGLDALLKAQLPKGGWPQVFPYAPSEQRYATVVRIEPDGSRTELKRPTRYSHYYTFNDNTINDCIAVCMEAHRRYGDARYLDAVRKAGDFIILSQLAAPQTGWAQQYTLDVKPEWARRFEPRSVCSAATSRNIRTLIEIHLATGDGKYLAPIPAAIDWLERSRLPGAEPRWARFYELGTNRPLYFTKDKYELTYRNDNMPTHYAFIVGGLLRKPAAQYRKVKEAGREAVLAERNRKPSAGDLREDAKRLEPEVRRIVGELDARGRWLHDGWIECSRFNRNLVRLADYVAACRGAGE